MNRSTITRQRWVAPVLITTLGLLVAACTSSNTVVYDDFPTMSMMDTIQIGATVTADESAYDNEEPNRTDIVTHGDPRAPEDSDDESVFVKRIIALGGETIQITNSTVLIDDIELAEPYLKAGTRTRDFGPLLIPQGHYFVMGDNRSSSQDSRYFGPIPADLIRGKVVEITNP
jgi:signal peptidase I